MKLLFKFFDLFYRPFINIESFEYIAPVSAGEIIEELYQTIKDREIFIKKLHGQIEMGEKIIYDLREERTKDFKVITNLREENKKLKNKYNRFEIMDI